jgi:hypothetical protein
VSSRLPILALVSALAACDPGFGVRGRVVAPRTPCSAGKAPEVVALGGALIEVRCKDGRSLLSATSARDGAFSGGEIGVMSLDCALHVTKPGYEPRVYSVADLCADYNHWFAGCMSLALEARLTPTQRD